MGKTLAVVNEIHNVVALAVFGGADDANRFIQRNQTRSSASRGSINRPLTFTTSPALTWSPMVALAIDKNVALFNKAIGFATRANSAFADVFIESG
jgi:hypothetical protein